MDTSFAQRVQYERLENGIDVAVLKTGVSDVVRCSVRFGSGSDALPSKPGRSMLLSGLLPAGVRGASRDDVLELFESLGARVSVSVGAAAIEAHVTCRKAVFAEVLTTLFDMCGSPRVTERDFREVRMRILNTLRIARDDTSTRARTALMRALYAKGNPHFAYTPEELAKDVERTTLADVREHYRNLVGTVGGNVVVVGDVQPRATRSLIRDCVQSLHEGRSALRSMVQSDRVVSNAAARTVVSMRDKMNIDTMFALPVSITRDCDERIALEAGVAILGSSGTGRLFRVLRSERSLTYGAVASLAGLTEGYPGFLLGRALFPNDVYQTGEAAFLEVVTKWQDKGVTSSELRRYKQEALGRYTVSLTTTASMCAALSAVLSAGRPVEYLDQYPNLVQDLRLSEVNSVIEEQCSGRTVTLAAAGSIDTNGKPLAATK